MPSVWRARRASSISGRSVVTTPLDQSRLFDCGLACYSTGFLVDGVRYAWQKHLPPSVDGTLFGALFRRQMPLNMTPNPK